MKWITVSWSGRSPSGKTSVWIVRSSEGGDLLGEIRWFARWRKYAFFPALHTVFEQDCLRDIAKFIEDETMAHRNRRNTERLDSR